MLAVLLLQQQIVVGTTRMSRLSTVTKRDFIRGATKTLTCCCVYNGMCFSIALCYVDSVFLQYPCFDLNTSRHVENIAIPSTCYFTLKWGLSQYTGFYSLDTKLQSKMYSMKHVESVTLFHSLQQQLC